MALPTAIGSRFGRLVPSRPSRATLLYGGYTALLFLAFLVITFPHDVVARRIAQDVSNETGWTVRYDDVSLGWLGAYRFHNVRLQSPAALEPTFAAGRLAVRPTLSALVRLSAFPATFTGELYGGSFSGSFGRGDEATIRFDWRDVDLALVPGMTKVLEGNWMGRFSGQLFLHGRGTIDGFGGAAKLLLRDAALANGHAAGFRIPDLHVGQGDADFVLDGGRLEVKRLRLAGPELEADLRGQIVLRAPVEQSPIQLSATVKPIPGSNEGRAIEGLLLLGNRNQRPPAGVYSYSLAGTLARPRVQ